MERFRHAFAKTIFQHKFAGVFPTWDELAAGVVKDVMHESYIVTDKATRTRTTELIAEQKFIPGGRYLYYAGRPLHAWNNCFLLKAEEDTREEWGRLIHRVSDCLMLGGGIGVEYSVLRAKNMPLRRTGGKASGPLPLMYEVNEIGRNVMQGGSRRSAIWAGLNWRHRDIWDFLTAKNWNWRVIGKARKGSRPYTLADAKADDFNFPAPLDMTNISVGYDDLFLAELGYRQEENVVNGGKSLPDVFMKNVEQALMTGEPGFSFNFGTKAYEILRNACTEVTSEDDSDVCNLGSVNMSRIETKEEFAEVCYHAAQFLVYGTLRAYLPYEKVYRVRQKNRRIGVGLMGLHEWLLKRNYRYEMNDELREWMRIYQEYTEKGANDLCDRLSINRPIAYRAIAPTGTIGILAATTTGIEPLYAVAYKRRYLTDGTKWRHEFVVDHVADVLIKEYGLKADEIETATDLALDPERRVKFQADVQDYVDQGISSTINLPAWGTEHNQYGTVEPFARILAQYAPRLRGLTCYPDGARGGQPITKVSYKEALSHAGMVFEENDICDITGGGSCGV